MFVYFRRILSVLLLVTCTSPEATALVPDDPATRQVMELGESILVLSRDPSRAATARLQRRLTTSREPLVRLWAAAALVERAPTIAELSTTVRQLGPAQLSALHAPLDTRLMALTRGEADPLLTWIAWHGTLPKRASEALRSHETSHLVNRMLGHPDARTRRTAASVITDLTLPGPLCDALLEALAPAEVAPWRGGPLFLPTTTCPDTQLTQIRAHLKGWISSAAGSNTAIGNQAANALRALPPEPR
jgi:hypothetical protein